MVYLKPNEETFSFPLRLSNEVERLFDEMIHRPWGRTHELRAWSPSVDLYETDDGYVLEADLPGVKTEDIRIDIDGNELILQSRRVMGTSPTRKRFHIIERCAGEFLRRIYLPESVDKEDIQTEFTDVEREEQEGRSFLRQVTVRQKEVPYECNLCRKTSAAEEGRRRDAAASRERATRSRR